MISLDLDEIGLCFSLVTELDQSDKWQSCIPILIQDKKLEGKLARLEFRIPEFCWHDMRFQPRIQATLYRYYSDKELAGLN